MLFLVQILKAKWKGLRDNFRVEFKRLPRDAAGELLINPEDHDTKWLHFKALIFLSKSFIKILIKIINKFNYSGSHAFPIK